MPVTHEKQISLRFFLLILVRAQKMVKYGISVSVLCFLFVLAIAERTSVAEKFWGEIRFSINFQIQISSKLIL